jgi:hypothetical protein
MIAYALLVGIKWPNRQFYDNGVVTGVLVSYSFAKILVSPINHPVAFIHETDTVFTDDRWNAIVNFDLTQHDDAIATLEENFHTAKTMAEQSQ